MPQKSAEDLKPIYVPWQTFEGFIARLKATGVPNRIDRSVLPSMSGSTGTKLTAALRYLRLVDSAGTSTDTLKKLAESHGTDEWKSALSDVISAKYHDVIGDLDIDNATPHQLEERFSAAGLTGQVRDKAIRFYLNALKASGSNISPHVAARKNGAGRRKPVVRQKKPSPESKANPKAVSSPGGTSTEPPRGMIDFPIPMGDKTGVIRVRSDLTMEHYPLVEAMLNTVKVLAETNSKAK